MQLSQLTTNIIPPAIATVNETADRLARAGRDVIRLGQAVPDLTPPPVVLEKVQAALAERYIHFYSPDPGLPEVREAIAHKLWTYNHIPCDPDSELLVTVGANHAFFQAILAVSEPGCEVILPSPCYLNHVMAVRMLGMIPVEVPMRVGETGYDLDPEAIIRAMTPKTRAVVMISPNNPTGAVYSKASMREVAIGAAERNIAILTDEVYEYFSAKHESLAADPELRPHVITLGSFSKTFGMTGWRVGYMVAPPQVTRELLKIHDTIAICATVISQVAVKAALEAPLDYLASYNQELLHREEVLRQELARIPQLQWIPPQGAMFGMARYRDKRCSQELALDILEKTGVALIPGGAFGEYGEGHLRISYGFANDETLREACHRLEGYFANA